MKWQGRCSECGKWGSIVEETATAGQASKSTKEAPPAPLLDLSAAKIDSAARTSTKISELDRVLSGETNLGIGETRSGINVART